MQQQFSRTIIDKPTPHEIDDYSERLERAATPDDIAHIIIDVCENANNQIFHIADLSDITSAIQSRQAQLVKQDLNPDSPITDEFMKIRRNTLLAMLEQAKELRESETNRTQPKTRKLAGVFCRSFMSDEHHLTDFIGGTKDSIDVLKAFSEVPEFHRAYEQLLASIAIDLMQDPNREQVVDELVDGKSTVEQLESLRLLRDIFMKAKNIRLSTKPPLPLREPSQIYDYLYSEERQQDIQLSDKAAALAEHLDKPEHYKTAFPMIAAHELHELFSRTIYWKDFYERMINSTGTLELLYARNGIHLMGNQAAYQAIPLAKDLVGARNRQGIIVGGGEVNDLNIVDAIPLKQLLEENDTRKVSDDEIKLFQELHTPLMQDDIERRLETHLADLSLTAQFRLVEFLSTKSINDYQRISDIANMYKQGESRQKFLEAFLATEFGSDLGDSIISIASKDIPRESFSHWDTPPEKGRISEQFFGLISSIRKNVAQWEKSAWFAKDDEHTEYFDGIKEALEMRVSQILSPVPDLMDGKTVTAEYFHGDDTPVATHELTSVDEALQGLKLLDVMTAKIAAAEAAPESEREQETGDHYFASMVAIGDAPVRVTMRPHETDDAEARMRWAVTLTPDEQMNIFGRHLSYTKRGKTRNAKIALRLDLEKATGRLSLDIGSSAKLSENDDLSYPDRLMATLVTAGTQNLLRRQGKDIADRDYHVREPFSEELSDPERFAAFVEAAEKQYAITTEHAIGVAAMAGTFMEPKKTPNRKERIAVYTGLFLDNGAQRKVAEQFPPQLPNIPEIPHMTIDFHPASIDELHVGEKEEITVTGIINDGRAQVLLVRSVDGREGHITLATGNNEKGKKIAPAYSKKAIADALRNKTVRWLEAPATLTATRGYFSTSGKVVVA